MATKNVAAQPSKKKNMGSSSLRSCEASVTSSKRAHAMKTRSMAKAAPLTATKQTVSPTSKFQDSTTQHKASSWMDEIQKLSLQSPVCEVEDYYSSASSSPSPKGARMSEIEAESSDTVIHASHDDRSCQPWRIAGKYSMTTFLRCSAEPFTSWPLDNTLR